MSVISPSYLVSENVYLFLFLFLLFFYSFDLPGTLMACPPFRFISSTTPLAFTE